MTARRGPGLERAAARAGLLAFAMITAGCVVAAVGYSGSAGEAYSPLNHWISELGQPGVSAWSGLFNLSLVLGGLAFIAFAIGLVVSSTSWLRWAFGPTGTVAGLGGVLVGVFPMNHPTEHVLAASAFFNLGWIFVALASVSFIRSANSRFPRWLAVVGGVSVAAFIGFIVSLATDDFSRARMAADGPISGRPDVWVSPILEWAALVGIMVWVLLTSIAWWRQLRREAAADRATGAAAGRGVAA